MTKFILAGITVIILIGILDTEKPHTASPSYTIESKIKESPVVETSKKEVEKTEQPNSSSIIDSENLEIEEVVVPRQEKNITKEAQDAIHYLTNKVSPQDQRFIRFFTLYAIPYEYRERAALTLSFVVHSLAGIDKNGTLGTYYPLAKMQNGVFIPIRNVPGSDTLYWIDLRDYNWDQEAWEKASIEDGYVVEPIIDREVNTALRLLIGNAIVRADWFIYHATDSTQQLDRGSKADIYSTLLYAKNEVPKTIEDFREVWGLDLEKARRYGNESGVLVLESKQVARHNRELFHYRTETGWFYESYDVLDQTGNRDYVEAFQANKGLPPQTSDAGEVFTSNHLQLQVYALRGGDGSIVATADAAVARHINDVQGDVRVRTAHSCIDCHAAGPIPAQNIIAEQADWLKLKMPTKEDTLRVERNFLSNNFENSVKDNQILFARAIKNTNGLSPEENQRYYLDMIRWYSEPVDVYQAAFEFGMTPEDFVNRMNNVEEVYPVKKIPGRIKLMLNPDKSIPIDRETWESPGRDGIPGMYQQCGIILFGPDKIQYVEPNKELPILQEIEEVEKTKEKILEEERPPLPEKEVIEAEKFVTSEDNVVIRSGTNILGIISNRETEINILDPKSVSYKGKEFVYIEYDGKKGYIEAHQLEGKNNEN